MKNTPILPVFLSWLLVLVLGSFLFHKHCGHLNSQSIEPNNEIGVKEYSSDAITQSAQVGSQTEVLSTETKPLSQKNVFPPQVLEDVKSNPNSNYLITSFYQQDEKNEGLFSNQGLMKANVLKSYLIEQGANPAHIGIASKMVKTSGELDEKFSIQKVNELDRAGVADYKILFEHNPIILYFDEETDLKNLNADQRVDFLDLVTYMDLDPSITLRVSGHSDESGEKEKDIYLSKERATYIKEYLIINGLSSNRLKLEAFGSDKPLGNNSTPQGKARNRRVEVSIDN